MIEWELRHYDPPKPGVRKKVLYVGTAGGLELSVVYGHVLHPNKWVFQCPELGIQATPTEAPDHESAQAIAVAEARKIVSRWWEALAPESEGTRAIAEAFGEAV